MFFGEKHNHAENRNGGNSSGLSHIHQVITLDNKHILESEVNCPQNPILTIHIYLQYYSEDNNDDNLFYIGNLMSL